MTSIHDNDPPAAEEHEMPQTAQLPDWKVQLFDRILSREGLFAVMAAALVWWIATGVSGDIKALRQDGQVHGSETSFYLRQLCISAAVQAGTPREACQQQLRERDR